MQLELENVSKQFPGRQVFKGYSEGFGRGFHLVIGPNGSGKTTLLDIMAGILAPDAGRVLYDRQDVFKSPRWYREKVGFTFQALNLVPGLSVAENILLPACNRRKNYRPRMKRLLRELGLSGKQDERIENLSGGEQRKVGLARAMLPEPEVLLADEPTADLDPENTLTVINMLKKYAEKAVVVMTTNDIRVKQLDGFRVITIGEWVK